MTIQSISSMIDMNNIILALTKQQDARINSVQTEKKNTQNDISSIDILRSQIIDLQDSFQKIDSTNELTSQNEMIESLSTLSQKYNQMKDVVKSTDIHDLNVLLLNKRIREQLKPEDITQLGLSFDKTGKMIFDESKFSKNFDADNVSIKNIAQKSFQTLIDHHQIFEKASDIYTGTLTLYEKRLEKKSDNLDKQVENLQRQKDYMKQNYVAQFARLQSYLNVMSEKESTIGQIVKQQA